MAELDVRDVSFRYSESGVERIRFEVDSGMVAALVGASGSGKTTLLKLIAGFLTPQQGEIWVGGQKVAHPAGGLAPHKRRIGLVFQHHALLPHLRVEENILFGCNEKGERRLVLLEQLLADFSITHLKGRYPHQISGGEQQRVALARALAARPQVLLMDEPFSSIDSVLRKQLRIECMEVLKRQGITTLLVTHDPEEALEIAERIMVLGQGTIQQIGTPHSIYYHPKNSEVAALFGEINTINDAHLAVALTGASDVPLRIRPEALHISKEGRGIAGNVRTVRYRGNHSLLGVAILGTTLTVHTHERAFAVGDAVQIQWQA